MGVGKGVFQKCKKWVICSALLQFLLWVPNGFSLMAQVHRMDDAIKRPLQFEKQKIASESFESVGVFDVNKDKVPDLVSGSYWYEGPNYLKRHFIGDFKRYGEYYDDFSTLPLDVNGDGYMDYITGGWFGKRLVWRENPGNEGEWAEHLIAEVGNIEAPRSWDIDGDGTPEIVPNTPNNPLMMYRLTTDSQGKPAGSFTPYKVMEKHGHGLGFGDINGDGRGDFVVSKGWMESPKNPFEGNWTFHPDFELGTASVPILVIDVNEDGQNDLIVGQGHGYGLHWYEQRKYADGKSSEWIKHPIDLNNSQFHTMIWTDLDNDGRNELVTGKRYRAHNGKDPGSNDPYGMYYYSFNGKSFDKQIIDYGVFGEGKGTGIHFWVTDLSGNGNKDIIVAGKDGLFIFYNKGHEQQSD
ncbi:VCBS repeat-containing protein [Ulvibacterium sp.]|uniref:FG-GAP repeat domain-containing protein n=1 Tax=Ulvibacterium sp. TaxID=2665914 RepID=UPI002632BFD3|nr:VCBS repeat-containing protein [Ulvibacterium sp.]